MVENLDDTRMVNGFQDIHLPLQLLQRRLMEDFQRNVFGRLTPVSLVDAPKSPRFPNYAVDAVRVDSVTGGKVTPPGV
jgi:hypothetical protein